MRHNDSHMRLFSLNSLEEEDCFGTKKQALELVTETTETGQQSAQM